MYLPVSFPVCVLFLIHFFVSLVVSDRHISVKSFVNSLPEFRGVIRPSFGVAAGEGCARQPCVAALSSPAWRGVPSAEGSLCIHQAARTLVCHLVVPCHIQCTLIPQNCYLEGNLMFQTLCLCSRFFLCPESALVLWRVLFLSSPGTVLRPC